MDDSVVSGGHDGYSLRELCAAGNGFAPGEIAARRRIILGGQVYTLDSRFVPLADYEAVKAELGKLRAALGGMSVADLGAIISSAGF